jgi:hypothetical protein
MNWQPVLSAIPLLWPHITHPACLDTHLRAKGLANRLGDFSVLPKTESYTTIAFIDKVPLFF